MGKILTAFLIQWGDGPQWGWQRSPPASGVPEDHPAAESTRWTAAVSPVTSLEGTTQDMELAHIYPMNKRIRGWYKHKLKWELAREGGRSAQLQGEGTGLPEGLRLIV